MAFAAAVPERPRVSVECQVLQAGEMLALYGDIGLFWILERVAYYNFRAYLSTMLLWRLLQMASHCDGKLIYLLFGVYRASRLESTTFGERRLLQLSLICMAGCSV